MSLIASNIFNALIMHCWYACYVCGRRCASVYHWCVTGASVRCQLIYLMCLVTKKFYVSHLLSTIGSGRVIFSTWKSYMDAVTAAFVEIKTSKFVKKVRLLYRCLCREMYLAKLCNYKQL